jgi:hypothetical protein
MCASLLSTSFHALRMPLLLHLRFLDNGQVFCRKSNLNPGLIGLHISGTINDRNKCHGSRATIGLANSKGEPSRVLPLDDDKQGICRLHIRVYNGDPIRVHNMSRFMSRVQDLRSPLMHGTRNKSFGHFMLAARQLCLDLDIQEMTLKKGVVRKGRHGRCRFAKMVPWSPRRGIPGRC